MRPYADLLASGKAARLERFTRTIERGMNAEEANMVEFGRQFIFLLRNNKNVENGTSSHVGGGFEDAAQRTLWKNAAK